MILYIIDKDKMIVTCTFSGFCMYIIMHLYCIINIVHLYIYIYVTQCYKGINDTAIMEKTHHVCFDFCCCIWPHSEIHKLQHNYDNWLIVYFHDFICFIFIKSATCKAHMMIWIIDCIFIGILESMILHIWNLELVTWQSCLEGLNTCHYFD